MPSTARYRGANCFTFASRARPPATISRSVSSSAAAVARATTFVMPNPSDSNSRSSLGSSRRGVKPAAWRVGQNRLPGRPKWWPIAAVYRPGLMPQNSTESPGAITSGTVRFFAAFNSAAVGRLASVTSGPAW
jgi:hypothetical protein